MGRWGGATRGAPSDPRRAGARAAYLAWLAAVQLAEEDDSSLEPPVPSGLGGLSASLDAFVDFLDLDRHLVDVAAMASSVLTRREPSPDEVRAFVTSLPVVEKDEILTRMLLEENRVLVRELWMRIWRQGQEVEEPAPTGRRTVSELLRAAKELSHERARLAREEARRERAEKERQEALARARYLDGLAGNEPSLWRKVRELVETKLPKRYDEAIQLLLDLRDLDARKGEGEFLAHMESLREEHARKTALIRRLGKAGL